MINRRHALLMFCALPACGVLSRDPAPQAVATPPARARPLYPNETPELRALINKYAGIHNIPVTLLHRVIIRESTHNPAARNGPYYGLMQVLPATARTMGYRGPNSGLLDAETNLKYAGRYLRGAWLLSDGDEPTAVGWYARGYYFEARDRCMLRVTGLADRERC